MSKGLREGLAKARVWVVKIGSAVLTSDGVALATNEIQRWAQQINELLRDGKQVVLVSSGAVSEGARRLGFDTRPETVHELQAAAAVGQAGIVRAYEDAFRLAGNEIALVLLTHDDLSDRGRYLNASATLKTLLDLGVVPIINENDSVATDEIRFGDNDTLAARVASLVSADALLLLTDQDGMFEADPRHSPNAQLLSECSAFDAKLDAMAGTGGDLGRGGMVTKVEAARFAARAGCHSVIAAGRRAGVITDIAKGDAIGTLLKADVPPMVARKRWIAGHLKPRGSMLLDAGATVAVARNGVSVLAIGVASVSGDFARGDVVRVLGSDQREIGRGIVNYSAQEASAIVGQPSDEIEGILGYVDELELVHRDNLALIEP